MPRLSLLLAAALFSTGGAVIKAASLSGWQVACLRSGFAALALLALLPSARRGWTPGAWAVGLAYGATMLLFVLANKLTTSANTIFLQSTAPLYIAVLSPWLLKERLRGADLGLMAALAGGLALVVGEQAAGQPTAPDPALGNTLAAVAGFTFAFTILGLRWLGARGSLAPVVAGNLVVFAVALPKALPLDTLAGADLSLMLYLGVFQIGLAYVFVTRGLAHVPAFEASLLLLLEPALNPLWTWLVHDERPGPMALLGGTLILTATIAKATLDRRRARLTG